MSTELAEVQSWTPDKVDLIKRTICVGATDDELQLFFYVCRKTGLDPLTRQIYALKRWRKDLGREVMTIQTGIDGYRVIAERTGKLAGIGDPVFDSEENAFPGKATVTVKKVVGQTIAEFVATARWTEYVQLGKEGVTGMWKKMPYLMLGKCAEALALRKAFPADLSGVYTAEEMAQADSEPERKAVEAEVSRQKEAYGQGTGATILVPADAINVSPVPGPYIPPELDWTPLTKSGVIMRRLLSVTERKKKQGGGTYLIIKVNSQADDIDTLFYFHDSLRDELKAAIRKVCKFSVDASDLKYPKVERVLEIDGQTIAKSEPEGDPEVKARLLASTLEPPMSEGDLKVMLVQCLGDWAEVLSRVEQFAAEKEVEVTQ